jgi:CDP-6-deoxy-D-xylo-4-hexulose-3-dehydrase
MALQELHGDQRFYSDDYLTDYDKRYVFERLGYNVRMTDIAAAFGIEQLKKLDQLNQKRRLSAALLRRLIQEIGSHVFETTEEKEGYFHTYYTFPILLKEGFPYSRRELTAHLERQGIETRPLFGGCLPDQPAFRTQPGRVAGDLPKARYLRDRALFVGIHPALEEAHIHSIARALKSFIQSKQGSLHALSS